MDLHFLDSIETLAHRLGTSMSTLFKITAIIIIALLLTNLIRRAINLFGYEIAKNSRDQDAVTRANTLGRVFRYIASVTIYLIAFMLILSELKINIAPILGAAGIVGVAIGFGAQSLVKDYVGGLFILIEDQIRQGDSIKIEGYEGTVEEITLRYVRLRDYDGFVHFIPNGQIRIVTNMGRDFSYATFEIALGYEVNLDKAIKLMQETSEKLRKSLSYRTKVLSDIEISGVDRLNESNLVIKARIKTQAMEHSNIKREYLRLMKQAFQKAKIKPAYSQLVVHRSR
ncbi:MAG: mechanosensitive ion channel family protein [Actinobacteria bacterium]|nr:mechanosensitive ion channel family protein [Actinomycetota bacterium]